MNTRQTLIETLSPPPEEMMDPLRLDLHERIERLAAENGRLRTALTMARAFLPIVRREMPHQESLEEIHRFVAEVLGADEQSASKEG